MPTAANDRPVKLAVVGSCNIDLIAGVAALPQPGETVLGGDLQTQFGGKGANEAIAAARLGASVTLIAKVGDDEFGRSYLEHLSKERIDTTLIRAATSAPTGTALILVGANGENMIAVCPGANARLVAADLDEAQAVIGQSDALLLQFEVPDETVRRAVKIANEGKTPVVLNPSPVKADFSFGSLRIDYLVVNQVEAEVLCGHKTLAEDDLSVAARKLMMMGAKHVVITRSSQPTFAAFEGGSLLVPTVTVQPVDTVGAGDTFAAALAVALCEQKDLESALRFANQAAALATLQLGAQASMPSRQSVDEALLKV